MAQQISGGYDFETKGSVNDHTCPICLKLIRDTAELPCTHIACEGCLLLCEKSNIQSACPKCRNIYNYYQKQRVRSTDRFIRNSIDVECKQTKDGCKWVGCIGDYQTSHSNKCEFVMVACCYIGCKEKLQRRHLHSHSQKCAWRPVPCIHCTDLKNSFDMKIHLNLCPMCPVECINYNCNEIVKRHELIKHCKETCKFQEVECPYHDIGCKAQIFRGNMATHCRSLIYYHSMLMMKNHIILSKKNSELEKQNTELERKFKEFDKKIAGLEEKVIKSDGDLINLTTNNAIMERKLKSAENAIDELRRVEPVQLKSSDDEMRNKRRHTLTQIPGTKKFRRVLP